MTNEVNTLKAQIQLLDARIDNTLEMMRSQHEQLLRVTELHERTKLILEAYRQRIELLENVLYATKQTRQARSQV